MAHKYKAPEIRGFITNGVALYKDKSCRKLVLTYLEADTLVITDTALVAVGIHIRVVLV